MDTPVFRRKEALRPALLVLAVLAASLGIGPLAAPPRAVPADVPGARCFIDADSTSVQWTVLEVACSHWEMGFALGRMLADDIRRLLALAHALCSAGGSPQDIPCGDGSAGLRNALPPALLAEAEGMAAGAQVRTSDILLLNRLFEAWFPPAAEGLGIMGFAASKQAVISGRALLGAGWRPAPEVPLVWVVRRPTDGLDTATLGVPGWLGGLAGMNEARVAGWVLPARTSDTSSAGLPAALVLRGALEQEATAQEALNWSMGQPHCGGAQIAFGGEASAAGAEWSARMQQPLITDASTLFAGGLFQHPDLAAVQLPAIDPSLFRAAQQRAEAAQATLRANSGWMSREKSLDFLSGWAETEIPSGDWVWLVLMEPAEMRVHAGRAFGGQPPAFTAFEPLPAPALR